MKMQQDEEKLPPQVSRMGQESADYRGIVPAPMPSSSYDGRGEVCVAGTPPERTTATSQREDELDGASETLLRQSELKTIKKEVGTVDTANTSRPKRSVADPEYAGEEGESWVDLVEAEHKSLASAPASTIILSAEEEVEADVEMADTKVITRLAAKRKKKPIVDSDSLEGPSEPEQRAKLLSTRKKRILYPTSQPAPIQGLPGYQYSDTAEPCSNPELSHSGLDGESSKGSRGKVGRPRKCTKAINPLFAEKEIMAVTGQAPERIEGEMLQSMTAADLSAQALEYLADVDIIRKKCGRMQGGLSGELRKRTQCLEDIVRALQRKADNQGDPGYLKSRIEDLLGEVKRNQREEERRKREISELHDIIKELRQENKGMREEIRKIKISIDRDVGRDIDRDVGRDIKHSPDRNRKSLDSSRPTQRLMEEPDIRKSYGRSRSPLSQDPARFNKEGEQRTSGYNKEGTEWVMRPPIQGKSLPIPVGNKGIIVKSNIQIAPPRTEAEQPSVQEQIQPVKPNLEKEWTTVVRKKKIKKVPQADKAIAKKERKRIPTTSVVSIKGISPEFSYADALKMARSKISLDKLEIKSPRIRKGMTGSTLIEIAGPDCAAKADKLALEIQRLLKEEAHVTRPNIKGELRMFGLDESIDPEEIRDAVAKEGNCKAEDVKVGRIGRARSGAGVVWIQCPKSAAITIAEKKKVGIGWTMVRVELLQTRPIQCHRCWRYGHVKERCKSQKSYLGCCFKCGVHGHTVQQCRNKTKCAVCAEIGMDYGHRMGSSNCKGVTMPIVANTGKISGDKKKLSAQPSAGVQSQDSSLLSVDVIDKDDVEVQSARRTDEEEDMCCE